MIDMPYIKKELRPPFNKAVELARSGDLAGAHSQILDAIKDYDFVKDYLIVDGCLNYVFTQLLRKMELLHIAHWIIFGTLKTLFWDKPRYGLLERAIGLLRAMKVEFERRGWREDAIPVIDVLSHFTETRVYEPYEDEAKLRNGDLE